MREEMYRKKFCNVVYPLGAEPQTVAHQLSDLGRKWLKPSTRSPEEIVELILVEPFIEILPKVAKQCLSHHPTISLDIIVRLINQYFTTGAIRPEERISDVRTAAHEFEPLSEGFGTVKAVTEINIENYKPLSVQDFLESNVTETAKSNLEQIRNPDVTARVDESKESNMIHQPNIVRIQSTDFVMQHPKSEQRESTENSELAFVTVNSELKPDIEIPSEADIGVADDLSVLEKNTIILASVRKVGGCEVCCVLDPPETVMTEVVDQSTLEVASIKSKGDEKMEELEEPSIIGPPELEAYKVLDQAVLELALVRPESRVKMEDLPTIGPANAEMCEAELVVVKLEGEVKVEKSERTSIITAPEPEMCEVELVYIGHEKEVKMEELEDPCLMGLINSESRESIDECKVDFVIVKPEEWENSSILVNSEPDTTEACSESSIVFETVDQENVLKTYKMEGSCSMDFQDFENKGMSLAAASQGKQSNSLDGIAATWNETNAAVHLSNLADQTFPGDSYPPLKSQIKRQRFVVVDNRLVAVTDNAEEATDEQDSFKEFETVDQENVLKIEVIDGSCSMDFQKSENKGMSIAADCQKKQHNTLPGIAASFWKTSDITEKAIPGDSSPPMKSPKRKQRFVVVNNILIAVTDDVAETTVELDSSISTVTDIAPRKKSKTRDYHEEKKLNTTLSESNNECFKEINVTVMRTPKQKQACMCTEHTQSSSNKQPTTAENQPTLARENSKNCNDPVKKLNMSSTATTQDGQEAKQYMCDECGKRFTYHISLHKHQEQTGVKPEPCALCEKTFSRLSCLLWHQTTHTCGKPHICSKCGKSFKFKSNLDKHQAHTKEEPATCSVCGCTFKNVGSLHKHEHIHKGPYPCTQCDKTFALPSSLHRHEHVHNDYKPNLCTECGETFKDASSLHKHEETHTKDKSSYSCTKCGEIFKNQSSLLLHEKKHTTVYSCKDCGKCFVFASTLHAHNQKHTGEKAFPCSEGGNSFRSQEGLHTHLTKFQCSVLSALNFHKQMHT